ncbi:hypothetical protein E1B28_002481 [Marasmius oreades]|uniref:Uncharacterized protein n=1 Tax=Marasmius oreades TaxID=181124 RepID=A0A9P7RNQ6_9AGAR|nr:uncharacterized protein E1B28_002481 [Marasmius oreades]KAG7086530.1 hypothetical protein E1B28_002481 [Marasmius oreades]
MPGIGKSVFLLYLLAKTLARKQPACIHIQNQTFAILGGEATDVYIVPNSSEIFSSSFLHDILFLIDMSWTGNNPEFMGGSNRLYQVGTSSPNPRLKQLKTWLKESRITPLVMNPPDVLDVAKILTHAFPSSKLPEREMQSFVRRLVQTFGVDLRRFHEVFNHPGFQSNRSIALAQVVDDFVDEVRTILDDMKVEELVKLIRGSSDSPQYFHRLIASYRKRPLLQTDLYLERKHSLRHEVRSHLLVNLLCEAWTNQADKMRTIMETLLSSNMKVAAALGWLFEAEGHTHIVANQSLNVYPMVRTQVGNNVRLTQNLNGHALSMEIGQRVMQLYDSASDPSTTHERNAYYVPMQVNNALFDSFLAGENFGVAFQMTRSAKHSFETKSLTRLRKRLEAICGKPSTFHFVFVIPQGRNLQVNIPNTALTRMFKYYTLPLATKSLDSQNPDLVNMLNENGMGGMLGEVEPEDGEYAEVGETADDGDIVMD